MAAHQLYLLHLGQLGLPDAETGETHFAQVPGYLIRTASGRTVLVDTGNPVSVIGQPTAPPWWDHPNDTRPQDDIVQRDHLDAARDDPRFDRALWDLPGIAYTPVDGDLDLEPGLRLIASPGHVVGHQSVYVETSEGPVLLAIDAISVAEQITMIRFPSTYPDPEAARRSRDKLVALTEETGAFLLMGHDAKQWATLAKSPAPFRRP